MKEVYCEIFFIACIPYDSHLPKMCEQMALSFTERSQHIQKQAALTVLRSYFLSQPYQYLHKIATTLREARSSTYHAVTPHTLYLEVQKPTRRVDNGKALILTSI